MLKTSEKLTCKIKKKTSFDPDDSDIEALHTPVHNISNVNQPVCNID